MKVTLVTTDFLPNIGGVTQHIVEIAKALLAGGDDVEVIAPLYTTDWKALNKPCYREVSDRIPVWRIPLVLNRSIRFVTGQISSRISNKRFEREILKRLDENPPDVVHWHALQTGGHSLAMWSRSAKVWTNHTSHFVTGIGSSQRRHYEEEARRADEIIAPSQELCQLTASLGIARERIHFISNGVDSSRFTPDANTSHWTDRLRLTSDQMLILCPRRLAKKNGVRYFIEAATSLLMEDRRDVRFAVAGNFSGPKSESEEDVVKTLVARSKFSDRFHLLGRVENKDMPGLYATSEFVVIPSLIEATSLSAMEAMAAGKPVISTDVGGLPFLIREGENGFLVRARQSGELARAMKRLLDSPSQRIEFGKHGRARAESELDWRLVAGRTKEIYKLAIDRHRALQMSSASADVH
jgi:glycosyltransferase involved in cell wall biosynthesis